MYLAHALAEKFFHSLCPTAYKFLCREPTREVYPNTCMPLLMTTSFEIVNAGLAEEGQGNDLDSSSSSLKLPPLRLLQSQEPKRNVTSSNITDKLEKAEERRKVHWKNS